MWRNVWAVVRREYLQRVRSKWFLVTTIGAPIFMVAMIAVPALISSQGEEAERHLAVVDGTGVLFDRVAPTLEEGGYTLEEVRWTSTVVDSLRRRAADGEIGGFILLDQLTLEAGDAVLYSESRPSTIRLATLRSAIARAALEFQLEQQGVDAESMLAGGGLKVELLSNGGSDTGEPRFIVAYIGAFLLYMVILLYSVAVMRATLEEKTSRVVEIIVSAMEPWHLMLGKILGVGGVGLTQMTVWLLSGILIFASGLPAMLAASPDLANLEGLREALPGPGLIGLFVGFFVCGFFMYSGLYAAVGAMCSTDEEAQQAQMPLVLVIVIPILFVMPVIEDPSSPLHMALSMFPLFTPILMWARVAGGGVPAGQIAMSFALMIAAIFAVAWAAGRIYKVGILMTGKRPTLPELLRWIREA